MEDLFVNSFFNLGNYAHRAIFEEVTYPWEAIAKLEAYLAKQPLGKIECEIPPTVHLVNPSLISIGSETVVEPGAYIQGPCIIGSNCLIRNAAYIRGNLITGENCVIGHTTEIKQSILLNNAKAAHFNYVGDSILGNRVNLGAGVKCANFRFDLSPVVINFRSQKIPTQLKKLGAIIGDGAQLGCNCVTNPGTLMGKGAISYPCLNIGGYIPPQSLIKAKEYGRSSSSK